MSVLASYFNTPEFRERHDRLTPGERFIFDWQYRLSGSFTQSLAVAMAHADPTNLARLHVAFPAEVEGMLNFKNTEGWWEDVERSMGVAP